MRELVYYVAASLDGYIAGPGGAIEAFIGEGSGVTRYLEDLQAFAHDHGMQLLTYRISPPA